MKTLLLILVTCLSCYGEMQLAGLNSIVGVVQEGENSIYPFVLVTTHGNTNNDGSFLFNVTASYSPLYFTNGCNEVMADDISPPIFAILKQWVHITNGVQTLGSIENYAIAGTGWMGSELSDEVELELMSSADTNGLHVLSICYDSDGIPGQTNGWRTVLGWVYSQAEVP